MVNISRFCVAVFLYTASLIIFAGQPVRYNGSTTYYEIPPKGIRGGVTSGLPTDFKTTSGRPIPVTQGYKGGIEIPAKKVKAPFVAKFGWSRNAVRNAVKAGLKLGKGSGYMIVGTFALEYLLEKTGWFIDDNGVLSYYSDSDYLQEGEYFYCGEVSYDSQWHEIKGSSVTDCLESWLKAHQQREIFKDKALQLDMYQCEIRLPIHTGWCGRLAGYSGIYTHVNNVKTCPSGYIYDGFGCLPDVLEARPVSDEMIDNVDFSDYEPNNSDIDFIKPHLSSPDNIEITSQPDPIVMPSETTTTKNPDGSTTSETSTTTINMTINNNAGDLYLDVEETTKTETYKDGEKISESVSTKKTDNSDSSDESTPIFDASPTDCDLVPTLCDIQSQQLENDKDFHDWVKEDPKLGDLPPLEIPTKELDLRKEKTISAGSKTCPTPYVLNLSIGTQTFEFTLLCEYARYLRIFLLACGYLLASRIVINSIRT